ncbi:hypothetical protein ACF05T_11545 [Streptomyces lateritius]|uniref:SseB protein N-terminal domain-containing protein n=1 Tax=Streptomyces lateritius TaxID=67313 RepID=A0ABW6YA72_9ACTN
MVSPAPSCHARARPVARVPRCPSPGEPGAPQDAEAEARRREFAAVLEIFRTTAVLVPRRDQPRLTVDFGGLRRILAFSDESALARYALARGEGGAEWGYETVLGARLLDVAVPSAGVPCGVALDAADGAEHAVLFPPVTGVVPESAAVDKGVEGADEWGAAR